MENERNGERLTAYELGRMGEKKESWIILCALEWKKYKVGELCAYVCSNWYRNIGHGGKYQPR